MIFLCQFYEYHEILEILLSRSILFRCHEIFVFLVESIYQLQIFPHSRFDFISVRALQLSINAQAFLFQSCFRRHKKILDFVDERSTLPLGRLLPMSSAQFLCRSPGILLFWGFCFYTPNCKTHSTTLSA